jgi:hypothetical protein
MIPRRSRARAREVCLEVPRRYNVLVSVSSRPPERNSPFPGAGLLKSSLLGLEAIGLRSVEIIIPIVPVARSRQNFTWGAL